MNTALSTVRIVFAGGGTGGHLYPAIAIADRIRQLAAGNFETEIIFVGTKRGLEYRLGDSLGYPLHLLNMRGLLRSLSLKNLLLPFVVAGALIKASLLLKRFKPDLVVGTGGYVAWPVLRAAVARKIPVVLQEQNSYPGIVTKQLAPRARRVYLGFDKARARLHTKNPLVTGNPVRTEINGGDREAALRHYDLDSNKKTILVLGGSQGARAINTAMTRSLLNKTLTSGYQILWQTGKRDYKDVTSDVGNKVSGCALFPFAEDMSLVYAAADLAIARAGALTLAELEACGIPAILVPYPHATEDHQRHNGQAMVDRGMARMIDERDLVDCDLLEEAMSLVENGQARQMKANLVAATTGRRPAVDVIAQDILDIIGEGRKDGIHDC
ncbi:MAG: undecaprenyldiphospho-muramoylpentapeptide beta-N-acetylglucosaminyltransferase [bacterium]